MAVACCAGLRECFRTEGRGCQGLEEPCRVVVDACSEFGVAQAGGTGDAESLLIADLRSGRVREVEVGASHVPEGFHLDAAGTVHLAILLLKEWQRDHCSLRAPGCFRALLQPLGLLDTPLCVDLVLALAWLQV